MATPLVLLAQQVLTALNGNADNSGCNNTAAFNGTALESAPKFPEIPTDISSLIAFLVSFSALRNWLKLAVLGSALETCRRLGLHFYRKMYNSFFITAHFDEGDTSYDWIMFWLSNQSAWKKARDVQISTRSFGLDSSSVMIEGEKEDGSLVLSGNRPLAYLPSVDSVYSFWYKKHWIRVSRTTKDGGYYGRKEEALSICIFSFDHKILNTLLLEAKKAYTAAQENLISVYVSDLSNNWRHIASRPKRPLTSIVLDPGIKDLLIDDARDFLQSKDWYSARGIPFRRGYLLYGAPGSGKTSIIHSLAGELGLDVYVISLSRVGLDDTALSELIAELPEQCIALMEDIDAAFGQTMNRDAQDIPVDSKEPKEGRGQQKQQPASVTTSRISLSGLLNALDGVGAQEGRILFATTNKYTSLDPALCRPGRMDIHIEFQLASKYQAKELYRCFYLPSPEDGVNKPQSEKDKEVEKEAEGADSGYSSANENEELTSSTSEISSGLTVAGSINVSGCSHCHRGPALSSRKVALLAAAFADAIPEREFSMAALQGYLMMYKTRPMDAIKGAPAWVEKERVEIARKTNVSSATALPPIAEVTKQIELLQKTETSDAAAQTQEVQP